MSFRDGSALTGIVDGLAGLHAPGLPAAAYLALPLRGLDGGLRPVLAWLGTNHSLGRVK
jgi:hypothetical protein